MTIFLVLICKWCTEEFSLCNVEIFVLCQYLPSECYLIRFFLLIHVCKFSGGEELETLILSDLFYHIQGELEGRQIDSRPFKELLQFLLDSKFLDVYKHKEDDNVLANVKSVPLYDTIRLKADLGLEMWDLSAWKDSNELAQTMLLCLQGANSRMLYSNSKLSALRGLIALLYMHDDNVSSSFLGKTNL